MEPAGREESLYFFVFVMEKYYRMKWDYRFTFGKHKAQRLDDVISQGIDGKSYAVWAYYCIENLDYADEVLDFLGLTKIDKHTTTDKALYDAWVQSLSEEERNQISFELLKNKSHATKHRQIKSSMRFNNYCHRDAYNYSKARLQSRNHGHLV